MDTAQKILALRKRMQKANVKALYISFLPILTSLNRLPITGKPFSG